MTSLIICPHCGRVVDVSNSNVAMLNQSTFGVWHRLSAVIKRGERFGVYRVAQIAHCSPPNAHYHLRQMITAGLVVAEPKRQGGTYHVYRFT